MLGAEDSGYLYIIIYPAVNIMCYVFVIYFLQRTNFKLTARYFSAAKPETKVKSKLFAADIGVSCRCTIFFEVLVHMFDANHSIL